MNCATIQFNVVVVGRQGLSTVLQKTKLFDIVATKSKLVATTVTKNSNYGVTL